MSEIRKANTDDWYFVTMTVVGWIDIFTRSRYADIIIESLQYCQINKQLNIGAYVIMPNHLHIILQMENGKLGAFFRDFKSYTAKKILEEVQNEQGESRKDWLLHLFKFHAKYNKQNKFYQFWQKTNYPILLDNAKIYDQKLHYIHNNPVRARIVSQEESYVFSSANPDQPLTLCF